MSKQESWGTGMPFIRTKQLEVLLEQKEYRKLVVKRIHDVCYLIVYDLEGRALVHCNLDGRPKEYRYAWQPLEWLQRRFALTDVTLE